MVRREKKNSYIIIRVVEDGNIIKIYIIKFG